MDYTKIVFISSCQCLAVNSRFMIIPYGGLYNYKEQLGDHGIRPVLHISNNNKYSTGAIVKNLASNVNLSHYMDLWTLGSKLQKNNCWTFFQ